MPKDLTYFKIYVSIISIDNRINVSLIVKPGHGMKYETIF